MACGPIIWNVSSSFPNDMIFGRNNFVGKDRLYNRRERTSGNPAIHMSEKAISCERTKRLARNHRIEAKRSPRIGDHKEALHENQEDVEPWPFLRLAVEAKPEVRCEEHAD